MTDYRDFKSPKTDADYQRDALAKARAYDAVPLPSPEGRCEARCPSCAWSTVANNSTDALKKLYEHQEFNHPLKANRNLTPGLP